MQQHRMSGVMRMYEKLKTLKDKLQKMKSNRANRQTGQTFHFSPFSRKQKQVLTWWCKESPVHDMDGVIADGAIRSGKTISMSLSFVMWAMSTFTGQNFAMCGKTIGSFRRNVLFWLKLMLRSRGYSITDHRADNLLTIRKDGKENYFYIFGGKDERSQDLIQGITLAGVFFDEVALMPESFVKGNSKAKAQEKAVKNAASDRKQYDQYRELLGKDMPKHFADFQEMKYNEPEKWELLRTYARSVDKGTISPLSGFENYQKIYDEINEKVVGIKTSEGTAVTRQSKHFMDRVIGTMKDPKTGRSRSGVTVEGIRDALENPAKVFPTRTDPDSRKSQKYIGRHGTVSLDPETGILIQCNPTDADYVRRIANGNAKI